MNIVTEALGVVTSVVISVFAIDRIYERRAEMRRTEELKRRLVVDAGSRSNDIALSAIEHIHAKDWLTGESGVLRNARLDYAELQNADLRGADLQGALLTHANLEEAKLSSPIGNDEMDQIFATILPDGSLHTEDVDLAKFTDPKNADFDATQEKIFGIRHALNLDNRLPPIS